jgi:hypothetical protein
MATSLAQVITINKRDTVLTSDAPFTLKSAVYDFSRLSKLLDVNVTESPNNAIFVYNEASGQWEDHTVSGTTSEVQVSFANNNLTIGLPDSVIVTDAFSSNTISFNNMDLGTY